MKVCQIGLVMCVLPLALGALALAGGEGLFSDDEQEQLKYLAGHNLPDFTPAPGGDPRLESGEEAVRAHELFRKGSSQLRLAIARSMTGALAQCRQEELMMSFWNACGADDYEARHSLVGVALIKAKPAEQAVLRKWLLEESNPDYAAPLLRNIRAYHLYKGLNPSDRDSFLPLLEQLYAQPGIVRGWYEGAPDGSIQAKATELVPATKAGRDLLFRWIAADSKKVDAQTLTCFWGRWLDMLLETRSGATKSNLLDDAFVAQAVRDRRIIESSLLYPRASLRGQEAVLRPYAREILYNPEKTIRETAIQTFLRHNPLQPDLYDYVRGMEAPPSFRSRAVTEAKAVFTARKRGDEARRVIADERIIRGQQKCLDEFIAAFGPQEREPRAQTHGAEAPMKE